MNMEKWRVITESTLGESVMPWASERSAAEDYRAVRDGCPHVLYGKLVRPDGTTAASFFRGKFYPKEGL